jgi:hypothetical protein
MKCAPDFVVSAIMARIMPATDAEGSSKVGTPD